MIEIYLQDMPGITTIKCTSIEGVQAIKQLYLDAIANDIHMRDFCRDEKDYETAELFQKQLGNRISVLNVLNRYILKYRVGIKEDDINELDTIRTEAKG